MTRTSSSTTLAMTSLGGAHQPTGGKRWLTLVGITAIASVAASLVSQYRFEMQPCPWCVFQRLVYLALGVSALFAAATRGGLLRGLGSLSAVLGVVGLLAALWQQLYSVNQSSCEQTLAEQIVGWLQLDRILPQVFVAYASCADAAVNIAGIPFAVWSVAMFAILLAAAVFAVRRHRPVVKSSLLRGGGKLN